LWIGTFGNGVTRIANGVASPYNTKNGLSSDEIWTMYEDRSGALWIGTGGGGVHRLRDGKFTTWRTSEGLSDDVNLAILQDHTGAVWIGTQHGGLNRFQDGKFKAIAPANGLADTLVFSLCEDLQGGLWVGTRKGLNYIRDGKIGLYTTRDGLPNNSVLALYRGRDGTIWVGTRGGLSKFSKGTFTNFTTEQGLSNNHVTSIQEDSKGGLWVGTDGGLNHLEKDRFTVYGSASGLSNTAVMSLYPESDGTLWIGTNGGGLTQFRDGRFTTYTTRDGLPDDAVFAIVGDDRGNLWASCNKGVYRVSKRDLNEFAEGRVRSITPVSYGTADGMKSAECNGGFQPSAWKGLDGKLWFPTMKGVTRIDLNRLGTTEPPLPVLIDRTKLNGAVSVAKTGVRVPPGRGDLEFVYTAVDFYRAQKLAFRYKLEGFDRDWIAAGSRRTAYYTNIPPGHYRFLVTVRNGDGVWTPRAASFEFALEPHFYQTSWSKGLAGLIILGLIATAHELRIRQHDRRENLLSQAVAERTKELRREIQEHEQTQEELLRAKQAAENASRAKSEFLANMSHEIRTPMHGVLGMTELALGTELTPEQLDYLNLARGSAQSLLSIINDILDFSKIEAGKLELDPVDFNLVQLLDECSKSLSIKAHEKGLEVICDVEPDVPEFLIGDPLRLRQILFNLAGNAIKFTLQGEIVIQVGLEHRNDAGIWLKFKVKESGIGIPPDKQKSIFDAFSQADSSTTRKFGGTGLGLGISSRLVQLMGGEITVCSQIGLGSEFQFSVRFEAAREARAEQPAACEELVGKAILVVDDNSTNRRMLGAALARWGMSVELAATGSEGLALFRRAQDRNAPFSLILTDSNMPEMDGFSLVETLRSEPEAAGTTVMMLSSGAQNGDVARCQKLRITSLMKPISLQELRNGLLRTLASARSAATPAVGGSAPATTVVNPLRILLAEDNPVNQKIAVRMLEKRGHIVDVVSNGVEALARLEEDSFDLLLTDMQMPQMDGFETAALIRAREQETGAHLPIIAMTALAMKGDDERCLTAGMDAYISKPMRASELFETVERFAPASSPADA
jgi:signal transduction histidine kinase/CheY-like chemotaxis protein/streptogramin lyase